MAMPIKLIAATTVAASVLLAGCNTAHKTIGMDDPYFGEAVRYNAALQTINPDPVYPEGGMEPGSSGAKGAAALNRYRTDQVNARHKAEVQAARSGGLSTTQTTGGGGGPR
jgi:predicted small secreted protein